MKLTLRIKSALYDARQKRLVLHGQARKESLFGSGYGEFRLELMGEHIAKLAMTYGLSDSLTSVQVLRALMDTDAEYTIED